MGIDPLAGTGSSLKHVSLHEAGAIARGRSTRTFALPNAPAPVAPSRASSRPATAAARSERPGTAESAPSPHTPVASAYGGDPAQWDGLLQRLGRKYNVPWLFLKAVMLSESGGRPDAVGDAGHSVGLFQLHDQGYGHGMGDSRYDPETNADVGAAGLAASWHKVVGAGPITEPGVRHTYDDTFNPGGGWAYQGDAVVRHYNALLAAEGLGPLPP